MKSLMIFLSMIAGLATVCTHADAEITEQIIFQRKKDGYNNIRIPVICRTTKGTLLAFAEGRVGGDAGKIHTILRRSEDGGRTWSKIQIVWSDGNNTCGNPAPIVDHNTGIIWLFNTWNLGSDHERDIMTGRSKFPRKVYLCKSTDDGKTWSKPVEMPHLRKQPWRWYATGPCNGIQLTRGPHKGRLICPANNSDRATPKRSSKTYRSHIIYSDDHGETWKLGGVQEPLTNESTVVELADGSVMQNMRSYHGKHNRAEAVSKDGGETFGELYLDDTLQSPVCQGSILRFSWLEDGKSRILFSSPAGKGREKMTIRLSYDEGKTWPISKEIYPGGGAYSNLVKLSDDAIGLLYEKDGYETIVFATIPLKELEAGARAKQSKTAK
ncbi:MAG: exo-alpha-sialidase [Pirellulales bacterium]|nr:exo-alpha-sialidase [Pirellulales bacterium]